VSAHSPGPWYFHNNAAGYDELRSPNGEVIAMWGEWPALTKADAELIRSAPEVLELLRGLQWSAGDDGDECPICNGTKPRDSYDEPGIVYNLDAFGHRVGCKLAALIARIDGIARSGSQHRL
jgi:hypothetical protein